MANFVSQVKLPNNTTYIIRDPNARTLDNNDFDTINVVELNAGDLIVTGVGRFTNGLYGNLIGNADTATSAIKATQDESGNNIKSSYASAISISDHTITLKNKNGTSLGTVTVPDNNTTYTVDTGTANGKIKVTPSSGDAYEVSVYGLKSAAYKNVVDTYSATGTDPVSGKAVAAAIDALPEPMVFLVLEVLSLLYLLMVRLKSEIPTKLSRQEHMLVSQQRLEILLSVLRRLVQQILGN